MVPIGYAAVLAVLAAAALAGAWVGSAYDPGERSWLPEAGCFIVLLGIWSTVGVLIRERLVLRTLTLRKQMLSVRIRRRFRHAIEERERFIDDLERSFAKRLEELHGRFQVGVGAIEASLLVFGTALWGFGEHIPVA